MPVSACELVPGKDRDELDGRIVEMRTQHPKMTNKEIALALGETESHIHCRIKTLLKAKEIKSRSGPGFRPRRGED